jgi:hypothetical protein
LETKKKKVFDMIHFFIKKIRLKTIKLENRTKKMLQKMFKKKRNEKAITKIICNQTKNY